VAHPNGMLQEISNVLPVRAMVHGLWRAIDPKLRRNAGGSWAPTVSSVPVAFSGGGTEPLVTVSDSAGQDVSLFWPTALPRPAVSGSVALYRNVLPGVSLRMEALVVTTAAAAADPRLRSLSYRVRVGGGLALRRGPGSSLAVVDARTGKLVFVAGRPLMWDSSHSQHFALPATADSAGSGRVTQVPVGYRLAGPAAATIVMAPPAAALTGPQVRYPVFIDPEIEPGTGYYVQLMAVSNGYTQSWTTSTGSTSQPGGQTEIGDCGYSNCYWDTSSGWALGYVDRDYFMFYTTDLLQRNGQAATVYYGSFDDEQTANSDGCYDQLSQLDSSGGIGPGTYWGGPEEAGLGDVYSNDGGGSGCPAGNVEFNTNNSSGLLGYMQQDADDNWGSLTLELRAQNESDEYQYKLFMDNPTLSVYFNYAPLTPSTVAPLGAVTCNSTTYVSANPPTLQATGQDNNPQPLPLDYDFTLYTSSGTAVTSADLTNNGGGFTSGTTVGWDSEGALTSGDSYEYDVYTTNVPPSGDPSSARSSPTSGMYAFTELSTQPSAPPTISSFDYPAEQWGQPAGAPGVFTVGTNGDKNIAGFAYSFDGSVTVPNTGDCKYLTNGGLGTSVNSNGGGNTSGELAVGPGGTAQIQVPSGLTPGQHTLYVESFDYAHNPSAEESAYTFYVAPNYQTTGATSQPVTYTNASSLAGSATGTNASLVTTQADSCCDISTWRGGSQLLFSATAVGDTFTIPLSVPDDGTWQLGAYMTTGPTYGDTEVYLDGSTALGGTSSVPFDSYNPVVSNTYLDLGTQYLAAGSHTLTFTVTGEDPLSTGVDIGINYLTLSPTNRYEADNLTWSGTNTAGTLAPQCASEPAWSDNCQLLLQNTASGTSFTLSFTAPVESDYALGVTLGTADDYGELRFDLDLPGGAVNMDNTAKVPIDTYSASTSSEYVYLGSAFLTTGITYTLKVTVVGTDSSSVGSRYDAGINLLQLAPVTGATDTSFTAAMNNLGIVSDGGTSAGYDFDLTGATTGNNLSLQALEAAGITPGTASGPATTSFNLDGATFTMPQLRTNTAGTVIDDNVIADGQTLPLPAVKTTGVALLAMGTCAFPPTRATPPASVALNYSGVTSKIDPIPAIPDWVAGAPNDAVMLLNHADSGSTTNTNQPRVFVVILPSNPNAPLASITLPVMPNNFLPGAGCPTALHILAIGTRTVTPGPSGTVWTGAYEAPMDTTAVQGPPMVNETLREVVPVSSDGSGYVRIHLSDAHTNTPVTFDEVTIAAGAGVTSSGGPMTLAAPEQLTFGGSDAVTIPAGGDVWSDAATMPSVTGGTGSLVVSMHIAASDTGTAGSIHDSTNLTTYYATGNYTTDQDGSDFSYPNSLAGQYYLSGVDVSDTTKTDGTIAVLGDQTATEAPTYTYGNWTSDLPAALSADDIAQPGSIVDASTDDGQPSDWWRMNGPDTATTPSTLDTTTTAYDSGSVGTNNLTLEGGPTWSSDNPGNGITQGSLSLNGTSQYAQSATSAVNTGGSFAVSAWAKLLSTPTHNVDVVGQDGTTDSAFYLDYEVATGDWSFKFPETDTDSPAFTTATGSPAVVGVWTHLVGTYNASSHTATLYVNGVQAATTTITPIASTGDVTVGAALYNGGRTDFFPGEISDVRVYNNATLWGYNASEIYNDLGTSSITTANAAAAFENYAAVEPNLRDVIISLGANDVLEGQSAATIISNLGALIADIQGSYFYDKPDASVQAFITTIPPLNLSSSDPREAVREAVNSWITGGDSAATGVFDIASAVAGSTENDVNSEYLTDGVPNSSYYQAIASSIAAQFAQWAGEVPVAGPSL
jgi:hypothetical protein